MATDDERREVAERLRELAHDVDEVSDFDLARTLDLEATSRYGYDSGDVLRLADLIDPCESGQNRDTNQDTVPKESPAVQKAPETCEHWLDGECYALRTARPVDRRALLALAGGLEADADRIIKAAKNARFGCGPRMSEAKHDACEWRSIARRIREACGVVDAG